MEIKYKKLFFICLLIAFIALPLTVGLNKIKINSSFALEIDYPSFGDLTITQNSSLPEYAKYFFNLGMALAGMLALIVITIGGAFYLISFASGKFTDNGKEWIKSGVIGLVILLSSYLIVNTINPDLVYFRLENLIPILSNVFPPGDRSQKQPPGSEYKEIPLGVITENLISRTRDCYDFDSKGNPIEGEKVRSDNNTISLPTYLDHDRVDCFLKLTDAAQRKAKVIKDLSDKIMELMAQCSCQGKCDLTCDSCTYSGVCPAPNPNQEGLCGGSCVGAGCQGENDCCPPGVKDKIQGTNDATIDIIDCQGNIKKYKGLEEFRTSLFNVSNLIESQIVIGGKKITIIDKIKWKNLKLIEQLMYLKEKMVQVESETQLDLDELKKAKTEMANCYDIKSSADFLKIKENTEKDKKTINPQKTFYDPITKDLVNSSKYCKGFNYSNSGCFKTCQDKCPDSSIQVASSYASCGHCEIDDSRCLVKQQACVEKKYNERPCTFSSSQEDSDFAGCIESCKGDCLDNCQKRYLLDSDNVECENPKECRDSNGVCSLTNCDDKCEDPRECRDSNGVCSLTNCDDNNPPPGECLDHYDQYKICENQCNNNSKCILDNKEKCLISGSGFQGCASQNSDSGNLISCINNNYLCKYGSNEYAGYKECLKAKNSALYSSPYLFVNPNLLRCPDPYKIVVGEETTAMCSEVFLETAKCLPSSKCPTCPCGLIDETIVFSGDSVGCLPGSCLGSDGICSPGNCFNKNTNNNNNGNQNGNGKISITVKKNVLVTAECSEFAYNNDPLTFYCRTGWEPEAPLSGRWSDCSMAEEIPVGQTVDDSIKWANELIEKMNSLNDPISEMLKAMKKIGDKKEDEYCKCNSKYDIDNKDQNKAGKPICASNCKYNEALIGCPLGSCLGSDGICSPGNCDNNSCPQGSCPGPNGWCSPINCGGYYCPPGSCFGPNGCSPLNCGYNGCPPGQCPGLGGCSLGNCSGSANTTNANENNSENQNKNENSVLNENSDPTLICFCSVTPCLGNPCQQMIDYLSEISDLYKKIRQGFIDFYVYFVSEEETDILKELTYSRKEMNSCSQQVVKKGEETTKTISCTRAYENNFIDKRCYGFLEGQIKNEELTDNWFCCKEALK
jgi:hypothetical protein